MNIAQTGHNLPPNPIDEALAPFDAVREEAEGWLDGKPVETEGQMKAVDELIKGMKAARKAVEVAEESAAKPIYDQWKAEKAKFAPTITDLEGSVVLPPGAYAIIATSTVSGTSGFWGSYTWEEVPI